LSELVVQVKTIDEIKAHPNAELLDIAVVGGWQCVVPKSEEFRTGDRVVFFPPDTVLPEEVSDRFGVTKYLSKGRIIHTKLRGEPSFGLVVRPDDPNWDVGKDVAEHYGARKYEPPVRPTAGDAEKPHPLFWTYTEIENLRNYPDVLQEGEPVVVTEKLHGTNARVALIEGQYMAGSKGLRRKLPTVKDELGERIDREALKSNLYAYPLMLEPVKALLDSLGEQHRQVILYGEVYGKVQSLNYGIPGKIEFRAFDLLLDGCYCDWRFFVDTVLSFGVERVPLVYEGPYSLDAIKQASVGESLVGGAHMREGVVVKPVQERTDPKVGRVILKYLSDDYLLSKHSDYTDI
jgi:RNA ligase (TIGR02306 family)